MIETTDAGRYILTESGVREKMTPVGRHRQVDASAVMSPCGQYRYVLTRQWAFGSPDCSTPAVAFIGLNPSTADALKDDPTIRRCIGFAKAWGFGKLVMLNLFAFRATKPGDMVSALDPIGPENDHFLMAEMGQADMVVAAWGAHGGHLQRDCRVRVMAEERDIQLHYLRLTKEGHPGHPLYLPSTLTPTPWQPT